MTLLVTFIMYMLEEIVYNLVKKGIIIFDKETNKYKLNESNRGDG